MPAQWVRCPRCHVALQVNPSGPQRCAACGADLATSTNGPSWYVVINKQKVGPLPQSELEQMSQSGKLKPDDMVLREGDRTWLPAGKVLQAFFGATVTAVPAAKQSMQETVDASRRTGTFAPSGSASVPPSLSGPPAAKSGPPSATPIPQVPGYDILEELGRGGMGVVYKAKQKGLNRLVALKMILAGGHAAASELQRFRAEAEAVARLPHPNIVQIYEIGEKDGVPFFSLEFVAGGTLSKRLAGTPLPPREAAQLTATLAQGIQAAHQAGIIHRDLKPANVLLGGTMGTPIAQCVPKVADFGLAKSLDDDSGQTRTGAIMGTPSYMSPEQASGLSKDIGPRTDLYALGAILYELLTGRPPFRAATVIETLEQVRSQEPVSPRTLQPGLPRDLETIALKCLQKDPAARYGTAHELADDLRRFLDNQPILARPASLQERAIKFVKRNRLLAGAASAVFLILLLGIITTSAQASRARKAERVAREGAADIERQLAQSHADHARMHTQRGQLKEALLEYQKAIDLGHPNSIQIRLDKARSHAALYQNDETRAILNELLEEPELGKHEGSVLLLKAYTTMGAKVDEAMAMIEQSLKKGLPAAEDAFARGLLTDSSVEAVRYCRLALKADPYHHPSHTMLGLLLVLLGRIEEAKEAGARADALFPDDPNMKILKAILRALSGRKQEAVEALQDIKHQVTARQFRVMQAAIEMLDFLHRLDDRGSPDEKIRLLALWARLIPDLDSVWPTMSGKVQRDPEKGAGDLLKMPPVLNKSLVEMMQAISTVMTDLKSNTGAQKLERILKNHPEGTLYYLYGSILARQQRYGEATKQLLIAARAPAMGRIKRIALSAALLCESTQIFRTPQREDPLLREALGHVQELVRLGPLREDDIELCAGLAIIARDFNLARYILGEGEKLGLGKSDALWGLRMMAEAQAGNPFGVIQAADVQLKADAKNADAIRERARAVEEVGKIARAIGAR